MVQDKNYDARYAEFSGESQYEDLLIPFDFYHKFQAETANLLKYHIEKKCAAHSTINVLEVGFGTGITTREILKIDPRIRVTAIDNEEKFVAIAKHNLAKDLDCIDRVQFIYADAVSYLHTLDDNSYDAFISVYTLHNFSPDYRRNVIELVSKKLKLGGVFVNGDKYAREDARHEIDFALEIKNHDKFDRLVHESEKRGDFNKAAYWKRLKDEGIQHAYKDEKIKITVAEQQYMFDEFGFTNVMWGNRYDLVAAVSAVKSVVA